MDDSAPRSLVICVGAVVLRGPAVLFVRQTYGSLKGRWSIPWGLVNGQNPDGSTDLPDQAAVRETEEEAGVRATVRGLLGVHNHVGREKGDPRLYLLFLCDHRGGDPTPDGRETDRAEYLTLHALEARKAEVEDFCYWIARRVLVGDFRVVPPRTDTPYHPHAAYL